MTFYDVSDRNAAREVDTLGSSLIQLHLTVKSLDISRSEPITSADFSHQIHF